MKRPLFLCLLLAGAVFTLSSFTTRSLPGDKAKYIPIQHNGRVKSFDAFSRQTLKLITEKETWDGIPAYQAMLKAIGKERAVANIKWIKIVYRQLSVHLGLSSSREYFSYDEILPASEKIEALVKSARTKRDQDIRPTLLEQKAESLMASLMAVRGLISGESLRVVPPRDGEIWFSPYEGPDVPSDQFTHLAKLFSEKKFVEFDERAKQWIQEIHAFTENKHKNAVEFEVQYLNARPFQAAWVLYLVAFILLGFLKQNAFARVLGPALLGLAFFFHSYGLVLRVLILSRPPVSNMYESMVFMNWVVMAVAIVFAGIRKNLTIAAVGSLISAIIMIYGDLLPIDTSLDVLVPVLRSNYWLTIHVLTIVSSYGVFGLAMGLGHWHLVRDMRAKFNREEEEQSGELIFRVIQVGVLLLGIGTTLGGVWANESWGRFWGWDPKETWALITFLGYLVVIHLKLTRVLKPFALAVSSVLGFLLVLMTWYGVNFVLGRGLHSYGQGAGGMMWVTTYLIFEVLFLSFALFTKLRKIRPA